MTNKERALKVLRDEDKRAYVSADERTDALARAITAALDEKDKCFGIYCPNCGSLAGRILKEGQR